MGSALSPTLSLFLANAVHTGPFVIGLFFAAYAAAEIVAGLVTGWLSDRRRDRRGVLWACAALSAVGALGMLARLAFPRPGGGHRFEG